MPTSTPVLSANGGSSSSNRSSQSGKSSKKNLMVSLKLPSNLLSRFPGVLSGIKEENPSTPSEVKERSSPASSSIDPAVPRSSADNASDTASTPAPGAAGDSPNKKDTPGSKPGNKRGSDSMAKPRGRPGPKKKPRVDDGTSEHPPKQIHSSHKLGPKANTGAINAGLRALDRSGTPCRKWERKPLQLKSFTGIYWQLPSWRTPKPKNVTETNEAKKVPIENGDSDAKANNNDDDDDDDDKNNNNNNNNDNNENDNNTASAGAVPNVAASADPSEKSNLGDGDMTPVPSNLESSPPAIAITA